ncbi:MAG: Xaa-Pro aminopeptidase [Rhodospirillaceae bacterium]|nr:Xaa-Pro aminopeptidase [Rhodospirillaceae bacterium]|tara:strand:+ start:577 stop:1884 length:1308 start_codon:yes stop_codon:yes gene_type:complete
MHPQEFKKRRQALMDLIGMGGIAVLPAATQRVRSRDVTHSYRQDSDFYYLTGFCEPEAVAVLIPGRSQGEFIIFCRERNREREMWDGIRAGPEGVVDEFGADDAFPVDDIDDILPGLLEQNERVYYSMGISQEFDQRFLGWMNLLHSRRQSGHAPDELITLDHLIHEMRLFKSAREVRVMKRSARIAEAAHFRAMSACRPEIKEYELAAEFYYEFARHGAECSYSPIIASGSNACILHYTNNDDVLKAGDLVLIDAGCEYEFYASDITRTFPVNGKFSAAQRELYEIVYEANRAATNQVQLGNHWNDPHDAALKVITRGLKDIGILRGRLPTLLKNQAYRPFFMHKTGHWLGMDVHDVGDYKVADQPRLLEAGMVMTIEPGIYVQPDTKGISKKWKGMGIRLEDDVYLSRVGPEVLSDLLPSSADEIESFMDARH